MDHSSSSSSSSRRRRMMVDAEGGRAVHQDRRARMLTVAAALQNVLVIACLLVTFYVYWNNARDAQRPPAFEENVHIWFLAVTVPTVHAPCSSSNALQFFEPISYNKMSVVGNNKDKIYINCTGPYILYMDACYRNHGSHEDKTSVTLQLQVAGEKTPVSSATLNALNVSHVVCTGLHSIAYLRKNDEVSLCLNSTSGFKLVNVTGGLTYLLGSRCEF